MSSEEARATIGDTFVYKKSLIPEWWYFNVGSMDYCLGFEDGKVKTIEKDEINGSDKIKVGMTTWEVEEILGETPYTTPMAEFPWHYAMKFIKWRDEWIINFMGDPLKAAEKKIVSINLY